MQRMLLFVLGVLSAIVLLSAKNSSAIDSQKVQAFIGQDLHLSGKKLLSSQLSTGEHALLFENGFEMSIGAWEFSGDKAVVWLQSKTTEFQGRVRVDYSTIVYMTGKISVKQLQGGKSTDLSQTIVENGQGQVVRFVVRGEVFVTADEMETGDPSERELYKKAKAQVKPIEQKFLIQKEAIVPEFKEEVPAEKAAVKKPAARKVRKKAVGKGGVAAKKEEKPAEGKMVEVKEITAPQAKEVEEANEVEVAAAWEEAAAEAGQAPSVKKEVKFIYPVNFSPVGGAKPKMESTRTEDGRDVATVIGRLYVWQKQDEKGRLLEMQADNAVIFYSSRSMSEKEKGESQGIMGKSPVQAIYLSGDVVMSEGQRTIKTDELYYDFYQKKAIAVNAVMRTFDSTRGIPIYVRAAKMRQVAENKFAADNITITTSEFYQPQVSITASSIIITDTTTVDEEMKKVSDSSYDAEMRDVRMKMGKQTVFYWPFMRANLWRPDIPIKSLRIGSNRIMGTSVESQWFLARILGLKEPKGTDSTLDVDYYSKRGFGTGVGIDYERDTYFGNIKSYLISDHGEDRLGRIDSRRDLKPDEELRGRFSWEHRQFMPYNWQLTAGISYLSDEHFLESFYRNEFGTRSQETYVHLKRTQDNWSLSFLGKGRINDFADELEELPSGEYHLTGQSLFDDRMTLYSDTQVGRLRQRIGEDHQIEMNEEFYTFASHRTELDIPMRIQPFKVVPYAAGTFGYDDRSGFQRSLVDGSPTGEPGEEQVWVGEAGIRVFPQPWWKVYPNAKSRLLDIDQLRHIIKPGFTAAVFNDNTSAFEQRDVFNFSLAQILQTKRGPLDQQRNVDWMRLDLEATFVDHQDEATDAGPGPSRFIWNKPFVPMRVYSAPEIFNGDLQPPSLQRFETFGPSRNNFTADYIWRLSDTTAFLSDAYIDMQTGSVDQMNVGFARLLWPNLSYYIGTRYLKRVEVLDEKGSNAFTFAATYVIDMRYTLVFAQQFDFEYGKNIENEITLIRRYHRMCWGITYRADETLDDKAIIFSIWPQGVPEMGMGSNRRYSGLGGAAGY